MELKPNPIDDAGFLKKLLVNTYLGWGYNAYGEANKDRAQDILLRNGICSVLGEARAALTERKLAIHRTIPTPSRENPFPGAEERSKIKEIEHTIKLVEATEVLVRNQPVPMDDRIWLRYRQEADFLPRLIRADEAMAGYAVCARQYAQDGSELALVEKEISKLNGAISDRRTILEPGLYAPRR